MVLNIKFFVVLSELLIIKNSIMSTIEELTKRIEQLEKKVKELTTEIEKIKGKDKEKDVPFKNPIIIA